MVKGGRERGRMRGKVLEKSLEGREDEAAGRGGHNEMRINPTDRGAGSGRGRERGRERTREGVRKVYRRTMRTEGGKSEAITCVSTPAVYKSGKERGKGGVRKICRGR